MNASPANTNQSPLESDFLLISLSNRAFQYAFNSVPNSPLEGGFFMTGNVELASRKSHRLQRERGSMMKKFSSGMICRRRKYDENRSCSGFSTHCKERRTLILPSSHPFFLANIHVTDSSAWETHHVQILSVLAGIPDQESQISVQRRVEKVEFGFRDDL